MLILDEPTSGVDPAGSGPVSGSCWSICRAIKNVTIFVSTHFMNEAARCDRIALMHEGRVLATGAPAAVTRGRGVATLEEAFIAYLEEASGVQAPRSGGRIVDAAETGRGPVATPAARREKNRVVLALRRMLAYTTRETLESCAIRSGCRSRCSAPLS